MKKGFTLAEVLITLTIIGIIAAMVIPNLVQRHLEQEMITKLKKTYNTLNNAVALAIRENGNIDEWELGSGSAESGPVIYENLKPYLKIRKDCGMARVATTGGCFPGHYKALFASDAANYYFGENYYKFTLEDGVSIAIYGGVTGCTSSVNCSAMHVDLNNTKGPNRYGVDMFWFELKPKNITPHGAKNSENSCKYNDNKNTNGYSCGAYVLYNGNMDYLRK